MSVRAVRPLVLALVAAVLTRSAWGQGRVACPSLSSNECYYTGAATVPTNEPSPSRRFILGGFFHVHNRGANAYECSDEMSEEGIMNLQAFLWGIQNYGANLRNDGISIGAVAFDSCMRLEQNIEYMLSYAQCKLYLQGLPQTNLVAYVGPYTNGAAMAMAPLATDLSVPLLTPTANDPAIMYQDNEFLLKLSPSFSYDVGAVSSLLQALQVDFVILLYDSHDPFWVSAYNSLSQALHASSICVQYERAFVTSELSDIIRELDERQVVRNVVPLMSRDKLQQLLDAVRVTDTIAGNALRFYMTSDIGQDLAFMTSQSTKVNSSLIIERSSTNTRFDTDLNSFAQALQQSPDGQFAGVTIPWITDYYARYGKPVIDASTPSTMRYMLSRTLEAVDGVMRGMESAVADCGGQPRQICDKYRNQANKGQNLLDVFSNAVFGGVNTNGSPMMSAINYKVYHYFVDRAGPKFDMVATVSVNNAGAMSTSFETGQRDSLRASSDSRCPSIGECCAPPTTAPPTTTTPDPASQTMGPTTDPNQSKMVAVMYPRDQEITGAYMDADRDDDDYGVRFDLNHKWIIALGVLAGLGILCVVVFEIYILYKLLGTRLGNKWRTMWLGQLLLFGVLLCYLTLFAYLPIPTKATCGITRFGVGVSYAICFAVLLVKLMVILTSRSNSDILLPGDAESPNYLKGIYQFLMFIFAVGVQVVIDIQWLITVPPEAVPVISNNGDRVWVCNHYTWEAGKEMDHMSGWVRTNFENHLISLTYIMVMILITTILSLNAHGIITNHRESVFIGIAAGFSIPIWLAWGLVGGLNDDHDYAQEFGDACIAFGLFCTATLILFAMFLPKVRQLVNMGVEGIYLEDDRETYYAGSVIMAPPSYKSKGPNSVIYVNNQGMYSEPVVIGNGDPSKSSVATHLRHPGSTYSAPAVFAKKADSAYGGSRVLRVTDDLKGRHPQKSRTQSEVGYGNGARASSKRGTLPRSRSQTSLGAL
ncbi:metabotropic glutamate receptor 2 [Plakobranchus ocellatus]|uniref:Metabotropic glutamate receptor 2 n=1 Tax=Plakobranchus ocellatus TaxID=259542 RepID=A0AAV3YXS3_9GAST|nr:metabotropic glutamate receptor 2 [Plakobranchus ocellatus]